MTYAAKSTNIVSYQKHHCTRLKSNIERLVHSQMAMTVIM